LRSDVSKPLTLSGFVFFCAVFEVLMSPFFFGELSQPFSLAAFLFFCAVCFGLAFDLLLERGVVVNTASSAGVSKRSPG